MLTVIAAAVLTLEGGTQSEAARIKNALIRLDAYDFKQLSKPGAQERYDRMLTTLTSRVTPRAFRWFMKHEPDYAMRIACLSYFGVALANKLGGTYFLGIAKSDPHRQVRNGAVHTLARALREGTLTRHLDRISNLAEHRAQRLIFDYQQLSALLEISYLATESRPRVANQNWIAPSSVVGSSRAIAQRVGLYQPNAKASHLNAARQFRELAERCERNARGMRE